MKVILFSLLLMGCHNSKPIKVARDASGVSRKAVGGWIRIYKRKVHVIEYADGNWSKPIFGEWEDHNGNGITDAELNRRNEYAKRALWDVK